MPPARRKVVAEVEPSAAPGAPAAPVVDLRVGTSPNNAPSDSATHGVFADPAIVSAAPLARGFALPAAVQARLAALHGAGGAPLQVHVETGSAPSSQAGAPVVLPRHQPLEQQTATAPTEDAEVDLSHLHATSTTAGTRPLIFSRRWNHRQQRHEVESETITTTFGAPGRGGRGRGGRAGTASAPPPMRENAGDAAFANSSDDVIRFGQRLPSGWHNDDAPASASSSSSSEEDDAEVGELPKDPAGRRRELARRKRHRDRVDRHLNDIEEGLKDDVEGSGDSSSSGSDEEGAADMMLFHHHQEGDEDNEEQQLPLPTRGGARPLFAQAEAESATLPTTAQPEEEEPTLSGRRSFGPMMYEQHLNSSAEHPCYHTLVQLTGPMTLRGPCGLVGMGLGETSVGGFLLGRKQLVLWSADHKVVAMPMRRLKSKQSQRAELPRWDKLQRYDDDATPGSSDDFVAMNVAEAKQAMHKARRGRGTSGAEEASELSDSDDDDWQTSHQYDVQSVFGSVDWPWVLDTVRRWTAAIPANERPSVVLVLQSYSPGIRPTWKYFTQRTETNPRGERSRRSGDANEESNGSPSDPDAYVEVPSFVARRSAQSIDLALLPQIIPTIAAQNSGCVAVLGSVNIGKSTLCRYLANLFISQHGLCYWLDLDMGQPEFGVPGQIGLFLIRQPLMEANDQRCVQLVRSFFLGSTSVQCPVSTGKAIAAMCDYCRPIAADHPMVVNTHGWVLSTGRRTTVEMLRRLQPRHVLHLLLPQEEDWTSDTAALMEPQHGLNAGVLGRRFLVRDGEGTGRLLGQLPHPYPSMPGAEGGAATSTTWRGQVHSVRVSRSGPGGRAPAPAKQKGSVARQSRWQTYMTPLLLFFAAQQALQPQRLPSLSRRRTTLLQAPLSALYRIIVVEMDEKQPREGGGAGSGRGGPPRGRGRDRGAGRHAPPPSSLSLDMRALVAGLEHSVVALQLHPVGEPRPSPPVGPPPIVSLAALPRGFTVTCYGYVESVEQTLSGEGPTLGQIAIRVPLECAVLEWMLSMGKPSATQPPTPVAISLALSPSIQKDVAFLDQQHTA